MLSFRMGKGDEEKQEVKKEKQKQKQELLESITHGST
jgi:hypothetical protein